MAALGVLIFLCLVRPRAVWWALVTLTCASVLAAELLNTALERLIDRLHPEVHPMIAVAKDCAAGAVLVLSFGSVAVLAALALELWGGL